MSEIREVELSEQALPKICRLCHREDNNSCVSVYDCIEPRKRPLIDRIYELFDIRVSKITILSEKCN